MKFDTTEVNVLIETSRADDDVPTETSRAKVGVLAQKKFSESDAFRKPDAAKIVVFLRPLFMKCGLKVRRFLIAGIVQHAVTLALFFLVEPLARASRAHIFFAVTYERVVIVLFRWLLY
jgi:hypothetical protein